MSPLKYYLLRATFDWAVENGLTPHVIVDANGADVAVPTRFTENGRIVLNISPQAVHEFHFDENAIAFRARFSGAEHQVYLPMAALLAIYARETGQGVSFPTDRGEELTAEPDKTPPDSSPPRKGPVLKIVK